MDDQVMREADAWGRVYGEIEAGMRSVGRRINAAEMQAATLFPRRAYAAIRRRADGLRCVGPDADARIIEAMAEIPAVSRYGYPDRPLPIEAQGAMILRIEMVAGHRR